MKIINKPSVFLLCVLYVLINAGCGSQVQTEEDVRNFIIETSKLGNNKDIYAIKKIISEDYKDKNNWNQQNVIRFLTGYFFRNPALQFSTQIISISLNDVGEKAGATIIIAEGVSATSPDSVQLTKARFHKFTVSLVHDKKWKIVSANYKRSKIEEYLAE